ncbi:sigma-70 family RNA polymerase sigma factor [Tundrisphaera lichenicola]|uniref:sigma-70 family RNA polymerase sigma factor n=1 Tax=Tundrisphaera lichenicola TaxID=2029860 RepID=UPI003EBCCC24
MTADPPPDLDPATSGPTEDQALGWISDHGDALFQFALGRLKSRELAEDLVQETFLAALGAIGRFEGRSTTRTWLVAILRRKIIDHHRKAAGSPLPQGPEVSTFFDDAGLWIRPPARWDSPEQSLEKEEFREVLDGCFDRLPRHLAEPFALRERDGVEAEEVRRILNLSAGNLRIRLHRARLHLRKCLEENWFRE